MGGDDISQITNVVNLYAVALDGHRYDLFEQVFTPDVRIDFGGGAEWSSRSALQEGFLAIHAVFSATQHIVSGHATMVDGDKACCLSYVYARFLRRLEDGLGVFDSTGWYDDKLVRTEQGWRIQHRISRMVAATGDHRVMQAMPGVNTDFQLFSLADEASAGRIGLLSLHART